jgi:hypothetical protein
VIEGWYVMAPKKCGPGTPCNRSGITGGHGSTQTVDAMALKAPVISRTSSPWRLLGDGRGVGMSEDEFMCGSQLRASACRKEPATHARVQASAIALTV